ncbi:hypothetical protein [Escherichia phage vB_EcoM_IME537]|uniref:Uncharacterized protein n=90 Tax=Tevenvirinae TaxID=1198136 RepID=A0A6H0XAM9_9CAUD|nr:hypothetical protein KMC13_gp248 [Escherichia phage vB_EcoM_IME537]QIW91487.1 hypothetical protein [Escherichia phage vB_EcoM_IME537]
MDLSRHHLVYTLYNILSYLLIAPPCPRIPQNFLKFFFFTKLFTSLFFHGTIQLSTTDTENNLENEMDNYGELFNFFMKCVSEDFGRTVNDIKVIGPDHPMFETYAVMGNEDGQWYTVKVVINMFTAEGYVKLSSKVYHDNDEIAEEYFNNMK